MPRIFTYAYIVLVIGLVAAQSPAQSVTADSRQLYEKAAKAIASADSRSAIALLEQLTTDQTTTLTLASIAAVHLAECYLQADRPTEATLLLEKWSDRIVATSKSTKLDPNLNLHHVRVWLQAVKRVADDSSAINSLQLLVSKLDSMADDQDFAEVNTSVRLELARRFATVGEFAAAEAQLRQLDEQGNSVASADVQFILAICNQRTGDHNQARRRFEAVVASDAGSRNAAQARLELATYAMQDRNFEAATLHLKPFIEQGTTSAQPSANSISPLESELECRFRLLWSELELAKGNSARSIEVLPSDAKISSLSEPQQCVVRFGRAEAFAKTGQHGGALKDFEWLSDHARSTEVLPNWASTVMLRRCELLLKIKEYSKLNDAVAEAKQRFPAFERMHELDYLLARASMLQVNFDQARRHLVAITESLSKNATAVARAQWMIGETYFLEQKFSEAIVAYKPVIAMVDQEAWQTLAAMQTAKCLELQSQYREAVDFYQQVVKKSKDEKIREEAKTRISTIERSATRAQSAPLR